MEVNHEKLLSFFRCMSKLFGEINKFWEKNGFKMN